MKDVIKFVFCVMAGLLFNSCLIDDESLDPSVLQSFENERYKGSDPSGDDLPTAVVNLTSVSTSNWNIYLEARVIPNKRIIKEVGFVWNASYTSPVPAPTISNNKGSVVSTLDGNVFTGIVSDQYTYRYVGVRAYVKDVHNNVFYSECQEVTP